jgi:squalene-hopene/tetraprenyl-beta-curcumene cyclase
MNRRTFFDRGIRVAGLVGLASWSTRGRAADGADLAVLVEKAVTFLRPRQGSDGSWSADRKEPGITALVVTALLRSRRVAPEDPTITKGLGYLEGYLDPKGGFAKAPHSVYTTSVALMAFQEANKSGRYTGVIRGGQDFLKSNQYDEGEGTGPADPSYGGAGYGGGNSRPDLSNTAFMVEALHDSGLPADDPALKKALMFVSRCQNRKSEFNDQPWADKVNDGGFIYNPGGGRESAAGKTSKGAAKEKASNAPIPSSAGMTYAGLKSMIYAGLKEDDNRVKAALDYIAKYYSVDENPGQGQRGLYYYYHTFARALAALGKPTLVDAEGRSHDWKADLIGALAKRQEANGGWVNREDRFMEGDPNIVTSYGLLALAATKLKG